MTNNNFFLSICQATKYSVAVIIRLALDAINDEGNYHLKN